MLRITARRAGDLLDLRHQVELMRLLRQLADERCVAVLMASHDLNTAAALADRVVLLDSGSGVAEGTADEVLRPDVLSRVYGLPKLKGGQKLKRVRPHFYKNEA